MSRAAGALAHTMRGAARLARFMPGLGVGMNRDGRASRLRSLGNFKSLECNGAFGLTARVGKVGRGSAVSPNSGEERRLLKFTKGAPPGERQSASFEA
jgi:hypothetical protein